ncbi:hypothetical protein GI582_21755 [Sulfitobacter sp. BDSS02]|uniref:hypothetical protein n=1 Tax=Heliomarina sp. TaxID=2917556 RepID=UPI004059B8F4|nr:hypothetical protein [Sulfitobacter sp. BDSS02]MBR9851367.1 hypothetical protein [Paracoccaceae bacterium]
MAGTKYPVILTSHMQEAIQGGAWIEVECVEAPEKGGNTHRGGWTVFVCSNDGQGGVHRSVYVTNRDLKPRVFKTAAGLMSFCLELDAKVFSCPLREGERGTWEFETTRHPTNG